MGDADWDQESDYSRYVLRGPSAEDLRHKADLDRKAEKENPEFQNGWDNHQADPPEQKPLAPELVFTLPEGYVPKDHPPLQCEHGVEINFGNACQECRQ